MTEPAIGCLSRWSQLAWSSRNGREVLGVLFESPANEVLPIEKIMGISAFFRSRF